MRSPVALDEKESGGIKIRAVGDASRHVSSARTCHNNGLAVDRCRIHSFIELCILPAIGSHVVHLNAQVGYSGSRTELRTVAAMLSQPLKAMTVTQLEMDGSVRPKYRIGDLLRNRPGLTPI